MQQRDICDRAVFDSSADDPRVLVRRLQQRLRADLTEKAEQEARRRSWTSILSLSTGPALDNLAVEGDPKRTVRRLRLAPKPQTAF